MQFNAKTHNGKEKLIEKYTLKKAVKFFCQSCSGSKSGPCESKDCNLFPYQFGVDSSKPKKERKPLTEEQIAKAKERMQKMHAARQAKKREENTAQ